MPDRDWISDALKVSRDKCPGLTKTAVDRLKELMRDSLGSRVLPAGDITDLARQLLTDMESADDPTKAP